MRRAYLIDPDGDRLLVHGTSEVVVVTVTAGDGTRTAGGFTRAQLDELLDAVAPPAAGPATGSRPLTPDAITDEMLLRALIAHYGGEGRTLDEFTDSGVEDMRDALTAALTVPPARPEGAEDIERVLRDYGINDGEQDFADFLAQRGVRVVTKETSR